MAKWHLKAFVQKSISYLPQKEKVNHFFQKHVTKGVLLTDEHFDNKLTHAKDHINYFKQYGQFSFAESTVLELGTGWYPIVPISLFLTGFQKVISIDLMAWLTKESLTTAIQMFKVWKEKGILANYLTDLKPERWDILEELITINEAVTLTAMCEKLNFYPVVRDARRSGLKENSIQYICSNNTFEHVFEEVLKNILQEFTRVIVKEGVMSHFIDMSDHFAHFDKSINIYNFLQFTEKAWKRIDNSIQPQNRLRFQDYKQMYEQVNIPITAENYRAGDVKALRTISLAPQYQQYTEKELAISHGYLISKM